MTDREVYQQLMADFTKQMALAEATRPKCSKHFAWRCLTANPRSAHRCKCACGGSRHGDVASTLEDLRRLLTSPLLIVVRHKVLLQ